MIRLRAAAPTGSVVPILVLAATMALTGCASQSGTRGAAGRSAADAGPPRISASDPFIPLPASPAVAAGYVTVHNTGGTADRLVKVSSPDARSVTMHRSTSTSMEPLESVAVPAHGSAVFSRGSDHLMIMGLHRTPVVGDTVEMDLTFAEAGTVVVEMPVKPLAYRPPDTGAGPGS